MKKLIPLMMFWLLVLPFQAQNYVVNGSFEYGLNANWTHTVPTFPYGAAFSLEKTADVMDGEVELRVDVKGNTGKMVFSSVDITVGDEEIYLLRFWARGAEWSKMYVEVEGSDTPGVLYEMHEGKTLFHLPFKTSQNDLTIRFYYQDAQQTYYLDGVEVLDQNNKENIDVLTTYIWHTNRGKGWVAGDNDVSLKLPDGRTIWFFNDSFYSEEGNDITNNPLYWRGRFIRNAVVLQDENDMLITYPVVEQGGQNVFFEAQDPIYEGGSLKNFFWVGDAIMEDNKVKVYLVDVAEVGGGAAPTGKSYLGIFSYPELEFEGYEKQADFCYGYETFFIDDEDGLIYLFKSKDGNEEMIVARTFVGNLNGKEPWEFWNGENWTSDVNESAVVNTMNADGVMKIESGSYAHVSKPGWMFDNEIKVSYAPAPQGPWTEPKTVYNIPRDTNYWWYMPNFHGELENGNISISYSVNSVEYGLFEEPYNTYIDKFWYRQRYIQVDLRDLSPYSEKIDCAGVKGGEAWIDECGDCVGGTTGKEPCVSGIAVLYADCNFAGNAVGLNVGDYLSEDLTSLGFADNDLSSVLIKDGYVVELYEGDNFSGNHIVLSSSSGCLDAQSFNNKVSSLIVRREGLTDIAGTYALENKQSGLYMSIENQSLLNKAAVIQAAYTDHDTQKFKFNYLGNGYYRITNVGSSHSLRPAGFSIASGTYIEQGNEEEINLLDLGGEISDQHNNSPAGYGVENLMNGSKEVYYQTPNKSSWVEFKANDSHIVTTYSLIAGETNLWAPNNWILYGSEDGQQWQLLDQRSGITFMSAFEEKSYTFENNTPYAYYKIDMETLFGPAIQLSEWRLYGEMDATLSAHSHSFIVQDAGDGYYRLINKQSDLVLDVLDGISVEGEAVWQVTDINQPGALWKFHDVSGLSIGKTEENASGSLLVYPNPAESFIHIKVPASVSGAQVMICNVSGIAVYQGELSTNTINVSELTPGYYIIMVTKDNEMKKAAFIKK